jgi:transcriptional regulator with XRE-family HTH domain
MPPAETAMGDLGKVLKDFRIFHGAKQTDAATLLGLSSSYVSQIESGERIPSLDVLGEYSRVFGFSVMEIFFITEHYGKTSKQLPKDVDSKINIMLEWHTMLNDFQSKDA